MCIYFIYIYKIHKILKLLKSEVAAGELGGFSHAHYMSMGHIPCI